MTTDTIPEARDLAKRTDNLVTLAPEEIKWLEQNTTEAVLAYHKRKLEECGGDARLLAMKLWNKAVLDREGEIDDYDPYDIEKMTELLQLHTAKAVEEATDKLDNQWSAEIYKLQKQCEALETALADWHKLADQRSEALIKAQQQCEESRQFVTYWRECFKQMAKERDDLRTRVNEVEVEVGKQIQAKLNQAVRAEKAEQQFEEAAKMSFDLAAEKRSVQEQLTRLQQEVEKLREYKDEAERLVNQHWDQLTTLQQDVKPLLGLADSDDPEWKMKTLDAFLTAHPECKP